jgi:ribose transport system ATP-binding protein
VLGLVGENGAGKSTLLGILNGTVRPDTGTLRIRGVPVPFGHPKELARHGLATVFQEQSLVATLFVYENLFFGREDAFTVGGVLRRRAMRKKAAEVLDSLGIPVAADARTDALGFAERQLVELARAFALETTVAARPIILLDEPTSALSDAETHLLFARVEQWRDRATFVFVSHRLQEVLRVCDRLMVLKDGETIAFHSAGGVTEAQLHELMVGRKRDTDYYKEPRQRRELGEPVLEVEGLSLEGSFEDVGFELRAGEVLGLAGVIGSGKSELAMTVSGALRPTAGQIRVGGRPLHLGSLPAAIHAGIGCLPQERTVEGVIPYLSVAWNLTLPALGRIRSGVSPLLSPRKERAFAQQMIERLAIKPPRRSALLTTLSGGNQQKVAIGKWMLGDLVVLVMDDPTRGVDVGAKEEIYGLVRGLSERGVACLVASDNMHEVIGLSNRILVMRDGRVSAELPAPPEAKPAEEDVVRHMV